MTLPRSRFPLAFLILATAFSAVAGCTWAVKRATEAGKTVATKAVIAAVEQKDPELGAEVKKTVEEKGAVEALKEHWISILLTMLFGPGAWKLWRDASRRKELLAILSKAVGTSTANGGNILDAIRHEVEAAGLSGSLRKNLVKAGVKVE